MARPTAEIKVRGIRSIAIGAAAVTLYGDVSDGPASARGREVSVFLADTNIGSILATLAGMPLYRQVFRAIADELDARDSRRLADDTAPVERVGLVLDSHQTRSRVRGIVNECINSAALAAG